MTERILVVDDERNIRRTLRMVLEGAGYEVLDADTAEAAATMLGREPIDLAILDLKLPGRSGLDLLGEVVDPEGGGAAIPVLVISGHASLAEAVAAIQAGAVDFLEKPLDRERVLVSISNALRTSRLEQEVAALRSRATERYEMIGEAPAMRALYGQIEKVAPTSARVLVTGESGSGKELVARAIHRLSARRDRPFVKVNCAAIPSELIESELFGYERGAFTGAQGRRRGFFELAHRGTLFLDEVGDMSSSAQAKVLRALQSGEVSRVGSERTIAVDVRVVAATNKDLSAEVEEGRFREDLYFRLNVVPLAVPPLRQRREDIPVLSATFVDELCGIHGRRPVRIQEATQAALAAYEWPGNVRELRNVLERMVILGGDPLAPGDLPPELRPPRTLGAEPGAGDSAAPAASEGPEGAPAPDGNAAALVVDRVVDPPDGADRPTLRAFRDAAERRYIEQTLTEVDWNVSRAAQLLGVERTSLHKRLRALGIRRD
ncbi:MAG TPA: sigma-54 dependent transcriptional regulator [Polyangiaceae bacterium LLY-WYZ-14_1]|nr:sigma-54 dependent transcriptional regulator [Polyangiaceae bacterium LLY-WYZ-14_1]